MSSYNLRSIVIHIFFVLSEVGLLIIQYQRSEIFAFDVLPDLADASILFLYGSQVFGILWVIVVILFTYIFWEAFLEFQKDQDKKIFLGITAILNLVVIIGEFSFFFLLVEEDKSGFLGPLIGFLFVGAHQVLSHWIMKNIIKNFYNNIKR